MSSERVKQQKAALSSFNRESGDLELRIILEDNENSVFSEHEAAQPGRVDWSMVRSSDASSCSMSDSDRILLSSSEYEDMKQAKANLRLGRSMRSVMANIVNMSRRRSTYKLLQPQKGYKPS